MRRVGIAASGLLLALTSSSALALGLGKFGRLIPAPEQTAASRAVHVHPFQNEFSPLLRHGGLGLFRPGQNSLDDAVTNHLRDIWLHPLIQLKADQRDTPLSISLGLESRVYRFWFKGLPLCRYEVRAQRLPGDEVMIVGRMPEVDAWAGADHWNWPEQDAAWDAALSALSAQDISTEDARLVSANRCWRVDAGSSMHPAWDLVMRSGGLPWAAISDGIDVTGLEKKFFDASATIRVYDRNPVSSGLADFTIDVDNSGKLTNDWFTTVVLGGGTRAEASNNSSSTPTFNFPSTDPRFNEASAFAHANRHLDFLKSIGYTWVGPKPITVAVNAFSGANEDNNNALYEPAETTGNLPRISIGNGSNNILRNLPADSDVVSHELGHHLIYRSLTHTDGESLVLHEGLSDFFAFAASGDSCLGESICPSGSRACVVLNKCLRTADNTLRYEDANWNAMEAKDAQHLMGQLVSAFLWDLRAQNKVPAEDLSRLANKAIDLLGSSSDIRDFLIALVSADRAVFGSKYGNAVVAAANNRGMTNLTEDIDLNGDLPAISNGTSGQSLGTSTPVGATPPRSKKSSGGGMCGVTGTAADGSMLIGLLLVLLPLTLIAAGKAAPVPVRSKKNKN
jgi:hypothetical protein